MLLQQSIEHMSIVYTCNALVHVIYLEISGQCSHTIPLQIHVYGVNTILFVGYIGFLVACFNGCNV